MTEITIPHAFNPRTYQLPFLQAMDSGYKRAVLIHHRRAGKDKVCFNFTIKKAFERVGTYFYFLPTFAQAKKVIWDNIDNDGFKMLNHIPQEVIKSTNATELKITLINGSIIQLMGADVFDKSGVGTNPIGVVFSEFSLQRPEIWGFIRPILLVNGGWAVFNGTPRGQNHAYNLLEMAKSKPEEWFTQLLTIDDTGVLTKEQIDNERAEGMPDALVDQEYYCKFIENATNFFRNIGDTCILQPQIENPLYMYQMGVDLAKYQDFTVISVINLHTFEQVYLERFNQLDWNIQKARIEAVYHRFNRPVGFIDATGVGDPIVEDLNNRGIRLEAYKFTEQTRKDLLTNMALKLEQRNVTLLDNDILEQEMSYFQYELTANGKLKIKVPDGLHDDCFVKGTMITTNKGDIPIENIHVGDFVLTREGYQLVESTRARKREVIDNLGLTGTPDHPVILADGTEKSLQHVTEHDIIHVWNKQKQQIEKLSYMEAKVIIDIQNQKEGHFPLITGDTINGKNHRSRFTGKSGLISTAKFQMDTIFTILMETLSTIIVKILNVFQSKNITTNIYKDEKKSVTGCVNNADVNLSMSHHYKNRNIVQLIVETNGGIKKNQESVVYNLQVANKPEYFANGILVHNCVFGTALSMFNLPSQPIRHNRLNSMNMGVTSIAEFSL